MCVNKEKEQCWDLLVNDGKERNITKKNERPSWPKIEKGVSEKICTCRNLGMGPHTCWVCYLTHMHLIIAS